MNPTSSSSLYPLVIMAYEPDDSLLLFLHSWKEQDGGPVLLINNGSGSTYDSLFQQTAGILPPESFFLLTLPEYKGVGNAIKEAIQKVPELWPESMGLVTMDANILYNVQDVQSIMKAMMEHPDRLILGVRDFEDPAIPAGAKRGALITGKTFQVVTGLYISDTQSHLRGIPASFYECLLTQKENRFNFEMKMLVECLEGWPLLEVKVSPPKKSPVRHPGYYSPVKDSVAMYWVLLGRLAKYAMTSIAASVIDLCLFSLFCRMLQPSWPLLYIAIATVLARIISASINFICNYTLVFHSHASVGASALKYFGICILQVILSAFFVSLWEWLFPGASEVGFKIIVDTCLFFLSYWIQKKFVYEKNGGIL